MAAYNIQKVLSVHHWTDAYFTFTCTRDESLRFENGQFVMVGLMVDGKPLMRAYSVASANYEEHLEFFSIKVQDGPLTSRLQHLKSATKSSSAKSPPAHWWPATSILANTSTYFPQAQASPPSWPLPKTLKSTTCLKK